MFNTNEQYEQRQGSQMTARNTKWVSKLAEYLKAVSWRDDFERNAQILVGQHKDRITFTPFSFRPIDGDHDWDMEVGTVYQGPQFYSSRFAHDEFLPHSYDVKLYLSGFRDESQPFDFGVQCGCRNPCCIHAFALLEALQGYATEEERLVKQVEDLHARLAKSGPAPVDHHAATAKLDCRVGSVTQRTTGIPVLTVALKVVNVDRSQDVYRGSGLLDTLSPADRRRYILLRGSAAANAGYGYQQSSTIEYPVDWPEQLEEIFRLADEGALLARQDGRPLDRVADLTPHWEWFIDEDGNQSLVLADDEGRKLDGIAKVGGQLVRIDLRKHTIGNLLCSIQWAIEAQRPMTLQPKQSKVVIKNFKKRPAQILPLPLDATKIQDVDLPPVPVVKTQLQRFDGNEHPVPVANLVMNYDGIEVAPEEFGARNVIIRKTDKGLRRIVRNTEAEERATQAMVERGLQNIASRTATEPVFALTGKRRTDVAAFVNRMNASKPDGVVVDLSGFTFVDVDQPVETNFVEDAHDARLYDVGLSIRIEGTTHDLAGVLVNVIEDPAFSMVPVEGESPDMPWAIRLDDGTLVRMPLSKVRALVAPIAEWLQVETKGKKTFRVSRLQAAMLAEEIGLARAELLPDLRTAIENLRKMTEPEVPPTPPGFVGELLPYQCDGVRWLNAIERIQLGSILGDEMGLGKTIQVLAHVAMLHEEFREGRRPAPMPVLVVVNASGVPGWIKKAAKFTPGLRAIMLIGNSRRDRFAEIPTCDIVVTHYDLLCRDIEQLCAFEYEAVIADEAQKVKNPTAKAAREIRRLRAKRFLVVTGTIMENHLGDLWAGVDLALPMYLGSTAHFNRAYRKPIEKLGNTERMELLKRRIAPFILRRTAKDVLPQLPPKTESIKDVVFGPAQRTLYETLRVAQHERVRQVIAEKGLARSHTDVFDALMKLRRLCCDPALVKLDSAKKVQEHAKLNAFEELILELLEQGRTIIVFSQFTDMLDIIQERLRQLAIKYLRLDGSTPADKRADRIEEFQRGSAPVFLASLGAGGASTDMTAADCVILYDNWWNPAVENQAIKRAHRMGQERHVFVYRLIVQDTVEVAIEELKERKAVLADALLDGGTTKALRFDEEDIEFLFGRRGDLPDDDVPQERKGGSEPTEVGTTGSET